LKPTIPNVISNFVFAEIVFAERIAFAKRIAFAERIVKKLVVVTRANRLRAIVNG
jgi:hypothetical protein